MGANNFLNSFWFRFATHFQASTNPQHHRLLEAPSRDPPFQTSPPPHWRGSNSPFGPAIFKSQL